MSVLVDTSVWSLALRRDKPPAGSRAVETLRLAVERGDVCLAGVVLQEVLQGFPSPDRARRLVDYLAPFPILALHRGDYLYAAEIRNKCRSKGLAISTVDAEIAAASINHGCPLLTVDRDFEGILRHFPLRLA